MVDMGEWSMADQYEQFGDELMGKIYPDGQYNVVVSKCEAGKTQNGKQAFKVVLTFEDGPFKGKTVPDQLTWSPESDVAARIFAQALSVLGAPPSWIKMEKPSNEVIASKVTGARVVVRLKEDEWNGQPRNRVAYLRSAGSGTPAQAESVVEMLDGKGPAKDAVEDPWTPTSLEDATAKPEEPSWP